MRRSSPKSDPASVAVSPGLAPGTVETTLILPFNDTENTVRIISERADEIAAVIIDPLSTAAGTCIPKPEFLAALRKVTAKHGIVLIFDEIVAFRIAPGGAQSVFGADPVPYIWRACTDICIDIGLDMYIDV